MRFSNKKWLTSLSLALLVGFSSVAQDAPFEKGGSPGLLPGLKKGFKPQISIAPQIGYISFTSDYINKNGIAYGAEIALQCPLACTKKNYIRQQVSFLYFQDTESDFTYWAATINPEYRFLVKPSFELAAGPSLGLSSAKLLDGFKAKNQFTYGASLSGTYHINNVFVGLSARYLAAGKIETITETSYNFNNLHGIIKLGYKF